MEPIQAAEGPAGTGHQREGGPTGDQKLKRSQAQQLSFSITMVSCQVCISQYDSEAHRPLLLPACGHTFCAFCVKMLWQQGKKYCPKCRKDNAVQPVSSLPVNYSLLEVSQSQLLCAGAEKTPSSSLEQTTVEERPCSPSLPKPLNAPRRQQYASLRKGKLRPGRIKDNFSQSSTVSWNPMHTLAREPTSAGDPSASELTLLHAPAGRDFQVHSPNFIQAHSEKEQQNDFDFNMAVHLTFCKDWNHDLNQHNNCPVWQKENEDN